MYFASDDPSMKLPALPFVWLHVTWTWSYVPNLLLESHLNMTLHTWSILIKCRKIHMICIRHSAFHTRSLNAVFKLNLRIGLYNYERCIFLCKEVNYGFRFGIRHLRTVARGITRIHLYYIYTDVGMIVLRVWGTRIFWAPLNTRFEEALLRLWLSEYHCATLVLWCFVFVVEANGLFTIIDSGKLLPTVAFRNMTIHALRSTI